ncbi:hypothetical protein [Aerosakkonema funiforme]|uniref:Uncharacterized protein n=1 Tax=Aerosakkonema funiforme FACHB-1375 TaxID=2949571 RepID=A0A926VLU3_9CYAN|nr:hypothetical protein [Aerosakkonema funiforme]MBD2185643.1 hypothetical protein [Aerosakkonema funiforme FACHB-1375]
MPTDKSSAFRSDRLQQTYPNPTFHQQHICVHPRLSASICGKNIENQLRSEAIVCNKHILTRHCTDKTSAFIRVYLHPSAVKTSTFDISPTKNLRSSALNISQNDISPTKNLRSSALNISQNDIPLTTHLRSSPLNISKIDMAATTHLRSSACICLHLR